MAAVNKVIILGNLGKDPETFTFDGGVKKTSFPVATTESYKDKNGNKVDQTEWHNIVCFSRLAEIAELYLNKGSQVYIEGRIKTSSWETDGVKKYRTDIIAYSLQMLSKAKQDEVQPEPTEQQPEYDDNLPF